MPQQDNQPRDENEDLVKRAKGKMESHIASITKVSTNIVKVIEKL